MNPILIVLAVSLTVGAPLGWLALHRGYPQRAWWVWATMPIGLGPVFGALALLSTRDPLVPWQCPSCSALERAAYHHRVAVGDGRTLPGDGRFTTAVVTGSMMALGSAFTGLLVAGQGGVTAFEWGLIAAIFTVGTAIVIHGIRGLRLSRVPQVLVIGYRCKRCSTEWQVETDPAEGANRAGAAIRSATAPDSEFLVESLQGFIQSTTPYSVTDHVARWDALRAIIRVGAPEATAALVRLLDDPTLTDSALGGLAHIRDAAAVPRIAELLEALASDTTAGEGAHAGSVQHAVAAAEALGFIGDARAAPVLERVASDPSIDERVAHAARQALRRLHIDAAA